MASRVKLIVGTGDKERSFVVPRLLLAQLSRVFEDLCADNNELINLPDDDPEDFDILVRYLKTEKLELTSMKKAAAIYSLLEKYSISKGKSACISYLERLINSDTAAAMLEISKELNNDYLSFKCWCHIVRETDEVLNSATFGNLKKETVSAIIRQDFLNTASDETESDSESEEKGRPYLNEIVDDATTENFVQAFVEKMKRLRMRSRLKELTIYKALVRWGKEEFDRSKQNGEEISLREILNPLLLHIRFLCMSHSEFAKLVWEDEILTEEEQKQIFEAKKNGTASLVTSEFLNGSLQERQKGEEPLSCKNKANSRQCVLKEVFRAKSHNLYIYGVVLHSECPALQVCSIEMKNITTQKEVKQKQVTLPLGNRIGVVFDDVVFLVAKGEEFEIIISSDKPLPCCVRRCLTSDFLERLPSSGGSVGHFEGIIALSLTP